MSIKSIFFTLLLTFTPSIISAGENSIGLDINSKDVEVLATFNLNKFMSYTDGTSYVLDVSYLGNEDNNLATLGISGQNMFQGLQGLSLAFGAKAVFAEDFLAFPLYAKAIYQLPLNDQFPPTYLSTGISYAPSVLSFRDAKSYAEFRLEADMEVISNIHIFAGYRRIKTNYENFNKTLNNSLYGGLKISF
jgi:hypothetical protein